jgi:hypothetical protein
MSKIVFPAETLELVKKIIARYPEEAKVGFVAYSSLSASRVEMVLAGGDGLRSVSTFHFSD